jgi:hypothetical protein
VNPRPLPPDTSSQDLQLLADIDYAVLDLDQAFSHLSDRSFACLSRPYQRLADTVLRVAVERSFRRA